MDDAFRPGGDRLAPLPAELNQDTGDYVENPELRQGDTSDDDGAYGTTRVLSVSQDVTSVAVPVGGSTGKAPFTKTELHKAANLPETDTISNTLYLQPISAGGQPIRLLAPDPNRIYLRITFRSLGDAASGSADDACIFSSEKLLCDGNSGHVFYPDSPIIMDSNPHTGEVRVAAEMSETSANARISVLSISRH